MILSHKYKFIFIKTFKTAGTSIEIFLSQHCADVDIVTPINPHVEPHIARNYKGFSNPLSELLFFKGRNIRVQEKFFRSVLKHFLKRQKFYNHIPANLLIQRIPKRTWNEYYKFCVVRNPWDLSLSHYHASSQRSGKDITFDEYIRIGDFRLNYHWYTSGSGDLLLDEVVKYESLLDGLDKVFHKIGVPFKGTLDIRAKSTYRREKTPYQDVYSDQQRKVIEKAFAKEITMHGYSF